MSSAETVTEVRATPPASAGRGNADDDDDISLPTTSAPTMQGRSAAVGFYRDFHRVSDAEHPQAGGAPSLKTDREACGIADATFRSER